MPRERPTYHESWYRIAQVRPKLRSVVQAYRHRYRGQTWYVLREPGTNRFFRLHESAYRFVGLLDGQRTLDEAWTKVSDTYGDEAPTQGEAVSLLGQLYTGNLLTADLPPDSQGIFERYRKRRRKEIGGYLLNIFFARIPLLDPDRFLDKTLPFTSWLFGPVGLLLWIALLAYGFSQLAGKWGALYEASSNVLAANNLLWLYGAGALAKAVHELGHGYACKRFGKPFGSHEVHTLGIMLIALIPMPYIDATSAWAIPNKWKRAFIAAAGMYVELALAAVAAVVWANTPADSQLHAFAYNLMFIASVSTLLFNANPLIKFDGYYILADLLEMPNLQLRSGEMFKFLWKKFIYGVREPHLPTRSWLEGVMLFLYCIASSIYRVLIMLWISIFVAGQLFFIGVLIALSGLAMFVLAPFVKLMHYIAVSPEVERTRWRTWGATAMTAAAIVLLIGALRLPEWGRAEAVVEPYQIAVIRAGVEGRVEPGVLDDQPVQAGEQLLLKLSNDRLPAEAKRLAAARREADARRELTAMSDLPSAQALDERVRAYDQAIANNREKNRRLEVRSPIDGVWIPSGASRKPGQPVKPNDALGVVASLDQLRVRVAADQYIGPTIAKRLSPGDRVEMRVRGEPDLFMYGVVEEVIPAGSKTLPSEALSLQAGGALALDPEAQSPKTAAPHFQICIRPADNQEHAAALMTGQRVAVLFRMGNTTLAARAYRELRQLLQQRFQI